MKKTYKINLPKGMTIKPDRIDYCYDNDSLNISVELEKKKYKPKDGDFVYVKAGYEHIAIFKKEVGEDMYVYANWNMSFSVSKIIMDDSTPLCCISDIKEICPATEREKMILIDQLAKVNKKWNPEMKAIEDVRWRAKKGEVYFHLIRYEVVVDQKEMGLPCDNKRYKTGNYYKTREAAEKAVEQIREIFRNSKAE